MKVEEPPSLPYRQAVRFPDKAAAGKVYDVAQLAIFAEPKCDLSVYRLAWEQVWHVAIIGVEPPPSLARQLREILSAGTPNELPSTVWVQLEERRRRAARLGPWVEGHLET